VTSQVGLRHYNGLKSNTNLSKPSAMPCFFKLGAEESKKTKSLRRELEMKDREIAKLKRQMTDRDKKDAERDNHIRERDMRVDAHISRTEQFIKQMEERDSRMKDSDIRREEIEGILRKILGRLERAAKNKGCNVPFLA